MTTSKQAETSAQVLIVDDVEANLTVLQTMLKRAGYRVHAARNGRQAMEILRAQTIELIISDILMPVMDGYELCRQCQQDKALRHIPFVFYTATYTSEKDRDFGLSLGAALFILKPMEHGAFLKEMDEVLRQFEAHKLPEIAATPVRTDDQILREHNIRLVHKLERKIAQLKESELLFRQLADNTDQVFWVTALQPEQMLYVSPAYERIWGLSAQELYADPRAWASAIHDEDRERVHATYTDWLSGKLPDYDVEYRIISKKGEIRWIHDNGSLIRDIEGKLLRVCGISNDISERKQAEIDISTAHVLLNQVFDRVTDAFVALDKDWRYTYVNARAGEIFKRHPEDLLGKNIWTEFPEGVGQSFQLAYERAMAEQKPIHFEDYYVPYDRWFENIVYPSPEGLSIYFHDITDRKLAEKELLEHRNHLEELVKERTNELLEQNKQMRRFTMLAAGRELRMQDLRDENERLQQQLAAIEQKN